MKKQLRKWSIILLALVFVGSSAVFLHQLYEQRMADRVYGEAARIAWAAEKSEKTPQAEPERQEPLDLPDAQLPLADEPEEVAQEPLPEQAQLLLDLDLEALRQTNADVLGWIYIPDTTISYPLMRSEDNHEYLSLTWDRSYSAVGSIFLECRSNADFSDFHTLVYGHNMNNGTMFGPLRDYQDQAFTDSHPCVYIATDDAILRYEVFSAYKAEVVSDTYRLHFEDDARKQSVIDFYLEQSEVECALIPTVEDQLLTLSTCTGLGNHNYRWVVHTVLTGQFPRN